MHRATTVERHSVRETNIAQRDRQTVTCSSGMCVRQRSKRYSARVTSEWLCLTEDYGNRLLDIRYSHARGIRADTCYCRSIDNAPFVFGRRECVCMSAVFQAGFNLFIFPTIFDIIIE